MSPFILVVSLTVLVAAIWASWKAPRLTSSLLWVLLATLFFSAALISIVPGGLRLRLIWTSLLLPFIWVGFLFWCHWEQQRWRVPLGMIGLTMLSGVLVFLFKPDL